MKKIIFVVSALALSLPALSQLNVGVGAKTDVGANVGLYTLYAALDPTLDVIAVEPNREMRERGELTPHALIEWRDCCLSVCLEESRRFTNLGASPFR